MKWKRETQKTSNLSIPTPKKIAAILLHGAENLQRVSECVFGGNFNFESVLSFSFLAQGTHYTFPLSLLFAELFSQPAT